jgi:tRNA (mo5U34)-methyltransferase
MQRIEKSQQHAGAPEDGIGGGIRSGENSVGQAAATNRSGSRARRALGAGSNASGPRWSARGTPPPNGSISARRLSRRETRRRVRALAPWFHNLRLNGVPTAPDHFLGDYPSVKWRRFADALPADLAGRSVLDIGCNAGFYAIEMKRRGAARVVGIDEDDRYLAQARFAAEVCGADIEFAKLSVYDVAKLGARFDIVLFMGVFYHLRHPLLALDLIRAHVARDLLVFQSMQRGSRRIASFAGDYRFSQRRIFHKPEFPRMYFIEKAYSGDRTNWWIPNRACVEALLRDAGFVIRAHPEREVYLCGCAPAKHLSLPQIPEPRSRDD